MQKPVVIFSDIFITAHNTASHPENPKRARVIKDVLEQMKDYLRIYPPQKIEERFILLVHQKEYLQTLKDLEVESPIFLDPDTLLLSDTLEAAFFAAGSGLQAIDFIKKKLAQRVFCAIRPPGHHAKKDKAAGFCIFNNIAVAAKYAQKQGFRRVLIIDFDAHHGDGTQEIFYEDNSVFYFSTHQYPAYPGTGSPEEIGKGKGLGFTLNFPLPPFCTDDLFVKSYRDNVEKICREFKPDILLVSAGYDVHRDDPLTQLSITEKGIEKVVSLILKQSLPTIFFLEGGYNLPALKQCFLITLRKLIQG